MTQPALYLDMDGVLADFDQGYEDYFGKGQRSCYWQSEIEGRDNVNWKLVASVPDFFLSLPPMRDAYALVNYTRRFTPTVLTGVPSSVGGIEQQKKSWINKHFPVLSRVICCTSVGKSAVAELGDILIDDWPKYRHIWEAKGGIWITHTSAAESITQLRGLGL